MHQVEGPEQAVRPGALGWTVPSMTPSTARSASAHPQRNMRFLLIWDLQSREGSAKWDADIITFGLLYHGISHSRARADCRTQPEMPEGPWNTYTSVSNPRCCWACNTKVKTRQRWHAQRGRGCSNMGWCTSKSLCLRVHITTRESRCSQQAAINRACKSLLLQPTCPEFRTRTSTRFTPGESISKRTFCSTTTKPKLSQRLLL